MKIGIIGTDSSHAIAFAKRLQQRGHEILAWQGGSTIALSEQRIATITTELKAQQVHFVETLEELNARCEACIITSVDAAQHLEQLQAISEKPVFIDKPIASTYEQALAIARYAQEQQLPIMSCSALRFANPVQQAKRKSIQAVEVIAPLLMLEQHDYFYYGIHALEMIVTLKGVAVQSVTLQQQQQQHFITVTYADKTVSTIRGYLNNRDSFQMLLHHEKSEYAEIVAGDVHYYDRLIDEMEQFFITKQSPIPIAETLKIIELLTQITAEAQSMDDFL